MKRRMHQHRLWLLLSLLSLSVELHTQPLRRYESEVFSNYTLESDIQYGQTSTQRLDTYMGTGDTATVRPLVIFIHGGGFKSGDKVSNFGTRVCGSLARRGYVVASINYRVTATIPNDTVHFEAMLRAMQDAKTAVRFFRRYAAQYGVDTSQIFATGSSAGSITALHLAFLDSVEVPSYVRWSSIGGTFEGISAHPGFSSRIHGAISNWGAIGDTVWMRSGDVPVFSVHGTADSTVFYEQIPADGPFLHSSKYIFQRAQNLNIRRGLRLFLNTGHTLDNNATKQDSAIKDFSAWLFTILRTTTTVNSRGGLLLPSAPRLRANYPNPFNPTTTVQFELPRPEDVAIDVVDLAGRVVSNLVNERRMAGTHRIVFDASGLASGVYVCRMIAAEKSESRQMLLLR